MKRKKRFGVLITLCLAVLALTGCSDNDTADPMQMVKAETAMEQTPIIDYTVPHTQPNVLLDTNGYQVGSEKEAVIKGAELPTAFEVRDAESREVVFRGELAQVSYHQESAGYIGYADFSELDKPGNYYLRCDIVGESPVFTIGTEIYSDLFLELLAALETECTQDTISSEAINYLLLTYEWYPNLFPDEDDNSKPDTLETVAAWIERNVEEMTEEGDFFAAVLAKFSYLYQKYDRKYANQCLQMASNLYSQETNRKGADSFYALTELYRASGLRKYHKELLAQEELFESSNSYLEQTGYLYGSMTYLGTRQDIDIDMCSTLMANMMDRAEEIANLHSDTLHPLSPRNNGEQEILKKAFELACANYTVNNYQYNHVQEEILHYMMGRNPRSLCLYDELEEKSGWLVLLAQLTNIYE